MSEEAAISATRVEAASGGLGFFVGFAMVVIGGIGFWGGFKTSESLSHRHIQDFGKVVLSTDIYACDLVRSKLPQPSITLAEFKAQAAKKEAPADE